MSDGSSSETVSKGHGLGTRDKRGDRAIHGIVTSAALGPKAGKKCKCTPGCHRTVNSRSEDGIHALCRPAFMARQAVLH